MQPTEEHTADAYAHVCPSNHTHRMTGHDKRPVTPEVPIHGGLSLDRQQTHRERGRSQSGNQPIKTREGRGFGEKGRGLMAS